MTTALYRPDIDGLRSIAVMSVVLFHADIRLFPGGYTGVDVFFVISGFLITRLIKSALEEDRFGFGDFYLRRARRLFPALFATLLMVLVVGSVLFLPTHLERLGGALISALLWCSNVFFWTETGYFDPGAGLKPLLHTWSLGVEEQFYLIWPTFLATLFAFNRASLLPGIALATVISLFFSQYLLAHNAGASFYLMPFRIFEFGVGALLVWVIERQPRNQTALDGLLLLGLAIVLYSFFAFDEHTPFPGVYALVPCAGTALVIYAGQARIAGPLLCNPVAIYLGTISYSLYLVHWPVVVLYKYATATFGAFDKLNVVLIAIVLAGLMYRFVETPLRRPKIPAGASTASARPFITGCILSSVALTLGSGAAWLGKGWPGRWDLPASILDMATNQRELRDRSWDLVNNVGGLNEPEFAPKDPSRVRLLVEGDSYSKDVFNAQRFPWLDVRRIQMHQYCLYLFSGDASPSGLSAQEAQDCQQELAEWNASSLPATADWVAYSVRWKANGLRDFAGFKQNLTNRTSAQVAVFSRKAEFADVPRLAVRFGKVEGLDEHAAQFRKTSLDKMNEKLKVIAAELGAPFLDLLPLTCLADGSKCHMVDGGDNLLFYDFGHWTLNGAKYFGAKMTVEQTLAPLKP